MDETLNVTNDTQENVVGSQEMEQAETTEQTVNADNGELTTPKVEKEPQSAEDNARFANYRRESEATANTNAQARIDKHYEDLYGESNNVHTEAEYNQAMQQQEYSEAGIDPDMINKIINDNPAIRQAQEIINRQQNDSRVSNEIQEMFAEYPESANADIPESVLKEAIESGIPLKYAYSKYANSQLTSKLAEYKKGTQTLDTNNKNALGSTGSTVGNGANVNNFIAKETFEANKSNQAWVSKNLELLQGSMNKWN